MVGWSLRLALNKATENIRSAVSAVSATYLDDGTRCRDSDELKIIKVIEERCRKVFFTSTAIRSPVVLAKAERPTDPKLASCKGAEEEVDSSSQPESTDLFVDDENDGDDNEMYSRVNQDETCHSQSCKTENSSPNVIQTESTNSNSSSLSEKTTLLNRWAGAINAYKQCRGDLRRSLILCHDEEGVSSSAAENSNKSVGSFGFGKGKDFRKNSVRFKKDNNILHLDEEGPAFGKLLLKSSAVSIIIHAFLIYSPVGEEKEALDEFLSACLDRRAGPSSASSSSISSDFLLLSQLVSLHHEHVRLSREHIAEVVRRVIRSIQESPLEREALDSLLQDTRTNTNQVIESDSHPSPSPRSVYLYAADGVSPIEEEIINCFEKSASALHLVDRADELLSSRERLQAPDTHTLEALGSPPSPRQASRSWFDSQKKRENLQTPSLFSANDSTYAASDRQVAKTNLLTHHDALRNDVMLLETRLIDEQSHLKDIHKYRKQKEKEMAAEEAKAMDLVSLLESEKAEAEKKLEQVKAKLRAAKARESRLLEEQRKFIESNNCLIDDLESKCDMTARDISQHTRECEVVMQTLKLLETGHNIVRDITLCGNVTIMDIRDKVVTMHLDDLKKLVLWQCDDVTEMMKQLSLVTMELSQEHGASSANKYANPQNGQQNASALTIKYCQLENKIINLFEEITKLKGQADNLCSKRESLLISTDEVQQALNNVFEKCESKRKQFQLLDKPQCILDHEETLRTQVRENC